MYWKIVRDIGYSPFCTASLLSGEIGCCPATTTIGITFISFRGCPCASLIYPIPTYPMPFWSSFTASTIA